MTAKTRCPWCENTFDDYVRYHDEEWGVPVHDDRLHFELLVLEGAQAGLSWSTILKRRTGYRQAFAQFDVQAVAAFDDDRIAKLTKNEAIIRHEGKIRSAVQNARLFTDIQHDFGSFDAYVWRWVDGAAIQNDFERMEQVPAQTAISQNLSDDLKERGFKFVGPTILYAYMQAAGLVNDHLTNCWRHAEVKNMD